MRIVFMGTPQLAASVLDELAEAHEIVCVYTRPDAVRGRGRALVASPVKQLALSRGLDVRTPDSLRDESVLDELRSFDPDAICVVAYGAILPASVLEIPRYGCLNVHTSLLPRWRGAAPMQRAILACDDEAGVCIMQMEEGLDTGPYCKRVVLPLDELYLDDLEAALASEGAHALVEALGEIEQGAAIWVAQEDAAITYASKIAKGELDISPADTARVASAKVRASDSAHPSHASVAGRGVTVERAAVAADEQAQAFCEGLQPGDVVFRGKRLFIQCADAPLEVEQLKPDGKKSMDARSFAAGVQGIKKNTMSWE